MLGGQMRLRMGVLFALALVGAEASQATTFSYDVLGRVTKVTPDSGVPVCYSYDATDNRTRVNPGCDNAPTAVNDHYTEVVTGAMPWSGHLSVMSNDTDPDPGDTLTIISAASTDGFSTTTVTAGGGTVSFSAPGPGIFTFTYTISDSHGLTSTANDEVDVNCRVAHGVPTC